MSRVTRVIAAVLICGGILIGTGCGGSSTGTKLRVLNASPTEANVNVFLDGSSTPLFSQLAYAANTGYLSVNSGSHTIQIQTVNSPTPIVSQSIVFSGNSQTTMILSNFPTNVTGEIYIDSTVVPSSGEFSIRVINSSPTMGAADVYVVPAGTDLGGTSPTFSSLGFEQSTTYQSFLAGAYEIFFTVPNSKSVYIDTGQISFTAGQNRTVVALNAGTGGGYTSVTLADLD